jgi:hypothetical protein
MTMTMMTTIVVVMTMMMVFSVGVRRKDVENKNFKLHVIDDVSGNKSTLLPNRLSARSSHSKFNARDLHAAVQGHQPAPPMVLTFLTAFGFDQACLLHPCL